MHRPLATLDRSGSEPLVETCRHAVAGASGGVPETVLDDQTGYVVPPRDLDQLVRRVVSLLCTPETAAAMGARGRREVSARHASGRSARVLRDLLGVDALPPAGTG